MFILLNIGLLYNTFHYVKLQQYQKFFYYFPEIFPYQHLYLIGSDYLDPTNQNTPQKNQCTQPVAHLVGVEEIVSMTIHMANL